jgi:hypothetical protein
LIPETNDELAAARRYMSLENPARVTRNKTVILPACPPDPPLISPKVGAPTQRR